MRRSGSVDLFKRSSRTFYNASRIFPKKVRADVVTLYAFVRSVDDFVDQTPQDREGFESFTDSFWEAYSGNGEADPVISGFVELAKRTGFERSWIDAFIQAMESDLGKVECRTLKETEHYMYGSAEVIGLMMARILDLPDKSHAYAQSLGRAFQYINMIRDVAEDNALGRRYLPLAELKRYGLESLEYAHVHDHEGAFRLFIDAQLARFDRWLRQAECGYSYLPKRSRIAIETAARLYMWTAERIREDPFVIYEKKVKPPVHVIAREASRSIV